ncbi:MAG: hypothetical protein JSV58_03875 [Candidatus Bathyarchaeota archaeon]|nr:MAG: hypothetical protein JSV58_03875 [Candidatus Bathyarchaeota archaeon]
MSQKKLSREQLLERIDELLNVLKMISRDLGEVAKSLQATPSPSVSEAVPTPPSATPAGRRGVEDAKMLFPGELEAMLTFEEKKDYIAIKPRQYLGPDNFSKIAAIIRGVGGEYVSAGKQSHFKVPREAE